MSRPPPRLPAGVHVFERGWLSANNILFTAGERTALVDSGYCTHSAQTVALVNQALGPRPLDALVNTHLHSDHCGGNAALKHAYPALRTLIPPGHAAEVARWDGAALTHETTGQSCPRFGFDQVLVPGEELLLGVHRWQIHAAAGHDPHSVILFQPEERLLISADALWENGFGVIFPELDGQDAFDDVAATLDLIERLAPLTVIPGHGAVFDDTPKALAVARRRLEFFIAQPEKHAVHAVKVLMKFKLLEVQRQALPEFLQWGAQTPYFDTIRRRFFPERALGSWLAQLADELDKPGVAEVRAGYIQNA